MTAPRTKMLRQPWIPALFLSLFGLAVRLVGIGRESIWLDEATSLFLARKSLPDLIAWTAKDIHPPLYYILLHFWRAFGESEAALRSLSAVAGAASVGVLYLLARRLFDGRTGVIAAVLLTLAPMHVAYSQQARMYTLLGLWVLLASYLLVFALEERKAGYWIAFTVVNVLSLYTHYYTVFGFLVQGLFALYVSWRKHSWWNLLWTGVAMTLSVLLYMPWIPTMVVQVSSGGGSWVAQTGVPGLRAIADVLIGFIVGNVRALYPAWMRWAAYILFAGLALWALVRGARSAAHGDRREESGIIFALVYLAAPIATAWLISQVKPLYSGRYLLVFLPGLLLLAARGLVILPPVGRDLISPYKVLRWGVAAVLVILLVFGVAQTAANPQNDDWRGAAAYVSEGAKPGDVAVFYPGWNEKPFDYYVREPLPSVTAFKVPLPQGEVESSVRPGLEGHSRAWLIWSIGHYGDPEGLVKAYLDRAHTFVEFRQFRGPIGVALYDLTFK